MLPEIACLSCPVNLERYPTRDLKDNPYSSPNFTPDAGRRTIALRNIVSYLTTSVLTGIVLGAGAITFYNMFVLAPIWESRLLKGDERWETVFFLASTALPTAIVCGVLFSIMLFHFLPFRLKHREILLAGIFALMLVSANRPVVSRIRRPGVPDPLFETVPDSINIGLLIFLALVMASGIIKRLILRKNKPRMVG